MDHTTQPASRLMLVDVARVFAIIFMVQDHALDALLSPAYHHGFVFDVWLFIRGLTAPTFLVLSGMSFTLATMRRWEAYVHLSSAVFKRLRRYLIFILLGYVLHSPVKTLQSISSVGAQGWRDWLQVDVLQCMGFTLICLQLLVLVAGTARRFGRLIMTVGAGIVILSPVIWMTDWSRHVPLSIASYLNAHTGSLFPVFPWSAYIFFGAALGYLYMTQESPGKMIPIWALALAGVLMPAAGVLLSKLPVNLYRYPETWAPSPNLFLVRVGCVCLLVSMAGYLTRSLSLPQQLVQSIAQESLLVYCAHICVIYGSTWNMGLRQTIGATLTPLASVAPVSALVVSMLLLAWAWDWYKRKAPWGSRLVRSTAIVLAVIYLVR